MTRMINLDEVVRLANLSLPREHQAFVSMSGGNTATIYAGPRYIKDDDGDYRDAEVELVPDVSDEAFWTVLAGPGVYRPAPAEAYVEEFTVGWDQDLCDNEPDPVLLLDPHPYLDRETRAAFRVVECWRRHPVVTSWGLT